MEVIEIQIPEQNYWPCAVRASTWGLEWEYTRGFLDGFCNSHTRRRGTHIIYAMLPNQSLPYWHENKSVTFLTWPAISITNRMECKLRSWRYFGFAFLISQSINSRIYRIPRNFESFNNHTFRQNLTWESYVYGRVRGEPAIFNWFIAVLYQEQRFSNYLSSTFTNKVEVTDFYFIIVLLSSRWLLGLVYQSRSSFRALLFRSLAACSRRR